MANLNGSTAAGHQKLRPEDLYSLEQYARQRAHFRSQVIAHKKLRSLQVGPIAPLLFEDRLTVQYQVQEMLRIELIFEAEGIEDEPGLGLGRVRGGRGEVDRGVDDRLERRAPLALRELEQHVVLAR